MEALIQQLRTLQSSTFIYYTKAHGYHWNVDGILFSQFHDMFSEIYEDAWSAVDGFAEWIRIFGETPVFDVQSVLSSSNVRYDLSPEISNPLQMLESLVDSNDQIILDLKSAFVVSDSIGEQGAADFIAERLAVHQKWRWKLTSSLKSIVNN
jgi:starvation-inducible DNA-binding protein